MMEIKYNEGHQEHLAATFYGPIPAMGMGTWLQPFIGPISVSRAMGWALGCNLIPVSRAMDGHLAATVYGQHPLPIVYGQHPLPIGKGIKITPPSPQRSMNSMIWWRYTNLQSPEALITIPHTTSTADLEVLLLHPPACHFSVAQES